MPIQNRELILNALQHVRSQVGETAKLSVTEVINELKEIIVEEFDPTQTLEACKDLWSNRISTVAAENGFVLLNRRPSWITIEPALLDKRNSPPTETPSEVPTSSSGRASSNARSRMSSSSTSSSNTALSYLLTPDDKQYVNDLYSGLDPSHMWTLSTGTVVEMQMKELALKCVVEHPSHSLILDLEDETWSEYFTQDELEEIRTHRSRGLILSPLDLQSYLDDLSHNDDIKNMHQELFAHYYNPTTNPSCYWAQRSLVDGLDLIRSGFFDSLEGHSERDFVTRIWRIMLTMFDYSNIMAREEIYSDACSNEMNKGRRLGSAAPLVRKRSSKRPDHLYSFEEKELGFLEAAKKCDENGNKEYKDACLKSPKTMKDFLLQLTKHNPELIHQIRIPCLITSALDVKMLLLDCPQGFVCRVISTETYRYPSSYLTYVPDVTSCLELGWLMKSILEETLSTLITPTRRAIQIKRKRRFEMPSSFVRGNKRTANNNATLPRLSRSR